MLPFEEETLDEVEENLDEVNEALDRRRRTEPSGDQLHDITWMAWRAEGRLTAGDLWQTSVDEKDLDLNHEQAKNALDYLAEQDVIDYEGGLTYDVGEENMLKNPDYDPGVLSKALGPLVGDPYIDDTHETFTTIEDLTHEYMKSDTDEYISHSIEADDGLESVEDPESSAPAADD